MRYHDPIDNDICVNVKKLINTNLKTFRNIRWEKKLEECDANHTTLFKISKSLKRKVTPIPPLQSGTAVSDQEKAQLIAETFLKNHENLLKNNMKVHTKLVNTTYSEFFSNKHSARNKWRSTHKLYGNLYYYKEYYE